MNKKRRKIEVEGESKSEPIYSMQSLAKDETSTEVNQENKEEQKLFEIDDDFAEFC